MIFWRSHRIPQARVLLFAITTVCLSILWDVSAYAQLVPVIQITAPAPEANIQPGETFQVVVAATHSSRITQEMVAVTPGPVLVTDKQESGDYLTFAVTLPALITPGRYYVTAMAGSKDGQSLSSSPVSIIVPLPDVLSPFQPVNGNLEIFSHAGEQRPLNMQIVQGSGMGILQLDPVFLSYTSLNPGIVTVTDTGIMTAQSPGQTQIKVGYYNQTNGYAVLVNVQVQGAPDAGTGKTDTQPASASEPPQ